MAYWGGVTGRARLRPGSRGIEAGPPLGGQGGGGGPDLSVVERPTTRYADLAGTYVISLPPSYTAFITCL